MLDMITLMPSPSAKGRSTLFNHFIDMRTTVNLSISCRNGKFQQKHVFSTWNGQINGCSHVYKMIELGKATFKGNRISEKSPLRYTLMFLQFLPKEKTPMTAYLVVSMLWVTGLVWSYLAGTRGRKRVDCAETIAQVKTKTRAMICTLRFILLNWTN